MDVVAKIVMDLFSTQNRDVICMYFQGLAQEGRFEGFTNIVVALAKLGRPDIIAAVRGSSSTVRRSPVAFKFEISACTHAHGRGYWIRLLAFATH